MLKPLISCPESGCCLGTLLKVGVGGRALSTLCLLAEIKTYIFNLHSSPTSKGAQAPRITQDLPPEHLGSRDGHPASRENKAALTLDPVGGEVGAKIFVTLTNISMQAKQ